MAVLVAVVAVLVAGLGLLVGLSLSTVHYYLPSPTGATSRRAWFGPGVVAAVMAALVLALTGIWLVLTIMGRTVRWMGYTVIGVLVVDVLVLVVVSGSSRPSF